MENETKPSLRGTDEMNDVQDITLPEISTLTGEEEFKSSKYPKGENLESEASATGEMNGAAASSPGESGGFESGAISLDPDLKENGNGKYHLQFDCEASTQSTVRQRVSGGKNRGSSNEDSDDGLISVDKVVVVDDRMKFSRERQEEIDSPPTREVEDVDSNRGLTMEQVEILNRETVRPNDCFWNIVECNLLSLFTVMVFFGGFGYFILWLSSQKESDNPKAVDI